MPWVCLVAHLLTASDAEAMKVLIVDDHARMRELIRSVVADLAEETIECGDGSQAVATYTLQRLGRSDRVLMDLEMPGLDGLEATRRLRTTFPDAQVIIVTQYGDPHFRAAAAEAGACGYVLKEDLRELRRLLKASPDGEEPT